jgi:chromosome segregation ATPase
MFHLKEKAFGGFGQVEKPAHVNDIVADALERQSIETELETLRRKYKKLKKKYRIAASELAEKQTDIKDILTQGMQLYGVINAGKAADSSQVQGLPPTHEVQIEKELSEADEFYEELKEQLGEQKLIAALKTWAVFASHPELRAEFQQIVKQKTM